VSRPEHIVPGFRYAADFLTPEDEKALATFLDAQSWEDVRMRGCVARRKQVSFGFAYVQRAQIVIPARPIPETLRDLGRRVASWAEEREPYDQVSAIRYPPGAGIGWHVDGLCFGDSVVSVSLFGPARLLLRSGTRQVEHALEPRSIYLLRGPARSTWEHSVRPVRAERIAITFRSVLPAALPWLDRAAS
jgi:alkylated DNA repair dioxygenase AlkB